MALVSTIYRSDLQRFNRLDAEYYQPRYLEYYERLRRMESLRLGDKTCAMITDGIHYAIDYDPKSNIRCLSAASPKQGYLDLSANKFISKKQHEQNLRTSLKDGDVIVSSVGTIGNCAVVTQEILPANADRDVGIIHLKGELNPFFVCAFLNSKYGKFQTMRESTGNVQLHLFIDKMKELLVPQIDEAEKIASLVKDAVSLLFEAERTYSIAESHLLSYLGFSKASLDNELTYTASFKQVQQNERLDPEYYQPKYDTIIQAMKSVTKNVQRLDEILALSKGIEVGTENYGTEGIPFLRVSNLNKFEISYDDIKCIPNELYGLLKVKFKPEKGELLISKDGTPGIAYVVKEEKEMIISSGILRAKLKIKIDPDYLALVLNSILIQSQIERHSSGSLILHWLPRQIKNTLIPILGDKEQQKIGNIVRDSRKMRSDAKNRIKEAVEMVETIIDAKSS